MIDQPVYAQIEEESPRGWSPYRKALITILVPDVGERRWLAQAACRGLDPAMFYPESRHDERLAVEVCERCPVRLHCLVWAAVHRDDDGIWGGATVAQRKALRRRIQRRRQKRREAQHG